MAKDKLEEENEKNPNVTSHRMDDDTMKGRDPQAHALGKDTEEDLLTTSSTQAGDRGKIENLDDTPGEGLGRK